MSTDDDAHRRAPTDWFGDRPPPPPEVAELVAAAHRFVTTALGIEPSLDVDTLPLVEHWLIEARPHLAERPELGPLLAHAAGAWLGEVLRSQRDAFWWLASPDPHDYRLCFREAFLALNPLGAAWDCLAGSTEHPGPDSRLYVAPEDLAGVEARLASAGLYSADEYLRLGVKVEAVELALAELRAEMTAGGQSDVLFDLEDYQSARDVLGLP